MIRGGKKTEASGNVRICYGRGKPGKTRKDFHHTEMKCYIELQRTQSPPLLAVVIASRFEEVAVVMVLGKCSHCRLGSLAYCSAA